MARCRELLPSHQESCAPNRLAEPSSFGEQIIDEKINDGVKIHGEHYDGDYLVQLVPTRKR